MSQAELSSIILPLSAPEACDSDLTGTKGANLAKMSQRGFPVPPASILTIRAYDAFARAIGLEAERVLALRTKRNAQDVEALAAGIRETIEGGKLPGGIEAAIVAAAERLGYPLAARSSATAEDLQDHAFAGQYVTELNINDSQSLLAGVLSCYASLYSPRALAYLHSLPERILDERRFGMAVVIQRMLNPELAGVMFTVNPITGNGGEVVIEAVEGLGESLVSGTITPARLIVSRETGEKLDFRPARQVQEELRPKRAESTDKVNGADPFTDFRLGTLMRTVGEVESVFHGPQDVEWAFDEGEFHLLQARPITGLRHIYPGNEWQRILDREYGVQYTEVSLKSLSPTAASETPFALYDQVYIPDEGNEVCFIGTLSWRRLEGACSSYTSAASLSQFEASFFDAAEGYIGFAQSLAAQDLASASSAQLANSYREYQVRAVRYCSFIWTTFIVNALLGERVRALLESHFAGQPEFNELERLALSPAGKAAIHRFSATVRAKGFKEDSLEDLHGDYKWLACLDLHNRPWSFKDFCARVDDLRRRTDGQPSVSRTVADRLASLGEGEQAVVSAAQRTAYIKDLRDDYRRRGVFFARKSLFQQIAERMGVQVEDLSYLLEEEILEFLENDMAIDKEMIAERKAGFAIYFDEERRVCCASGKDINRAMNWLGVGVEDVEGGNDVLGTSASPGYAQGRVVIVKGVRDLAKVKKGDVLVAVTTHPDYEPAMKRACAIVTNQGGILCHAAISAREDGIPCIVDTVDGTKRLVEGEHVAVDARRGVIRRLDVRAQTAELRGVAASRGTAEGEVVVVRGVTDLEKVKPTSVLVAVTTNPSYLAAIRNSIAVVTNRGGILSHAGIVCREMGIPCVVDTGDATKRLSDGDRVRVDGAHGVVEVVRSTDSHLSA